MHQYVGAVPWQFEDIIGGVTQNHLESGKKKMYKIFESMQT